MDTTRQTDMKEQLGKEHPGRDGQDGHAARAPAAPPPQPHGAGEHDIPRDLPRPGPVTLIAVGLLVVVLLAGVFILGWLPHHRDARAAHEDAAEQASAELVVTVAAPSETATSKDLILPCDVKPNQETAIYPRANGYLAKLYVDIQDRVEAGQVLADISTPEVDAQLAQSKANLEQVKAAQVKAEADLTLAQRQFKRFQTAFGLKNEVVSQQEMDEKQAALDQGVAAVAQAKANVVAGEAEVQRLTVLKGFEKVVAPFSGVVTARNYDVGALLNPANSGPGKELFRLVESDTVRVFINVPQTYATAIRTRQPAFLSVRNYPEREFTGTVARAAGAIDPATRTMRYELHFPNKKGELYAGMYGQARVLVTQDRPVLVVPASALLFNAGGSQVAVVRDGKVHMEPITVGRDLGTELEVVKGLAPDDQVVINPGMRLVEGVRVQAKVADKGADKPGDKPGMKRAAAKAD